MGVQYYINAINTANQRKNSLYQALNKKREELEKLEIFLNYHQLQTEKIEDQLNEKSQRIENADILESEVKSYLPYKEIMLKLIKGTQRSTQHQIFAHEDAAIKQSIAMKKAEIELLGADIRSCNNSISTLQYQLKVERGKQNV